MRVIINADDFGFSKGVNLGILEAFENGVVSDTSLMCNMQGFEHAVELMKKHPVLKVGIHFTTSVGPSLTRGKTISDENGMLIHNQQSIANCDEEELYAEYHAQLQKFLATGFVPTHIDWHWCYTPVQVRVAARLAKEYNLPLRTETKEIEAYFEEQGLKYSKNMEQDFYNYDPNYKENLVTTAENLIMQLKKHLDKGDEETCIMCHPAYVDQTVMTYTSYNLQRTYELVAVTDPSVKQFIKDNNIELISFNEL